MNEENAPTQDEPWVDPKTQRRLFLAFGGVTASFVLMVIVVLPYRLYERDVQESRTKAREISELILEMSRANPTWGSADSLRRIEGESEPPNLAAEKNTGCGHF